MKLDEDEDRRRWLRRGVVMIEEREDVGVSTQPHPVKKSCALHFL